MGAYCPVKINCKENFGWYIYFQTGYFMTLYSQIYEPTKIDFDEQKWLHGKLLDTMN